MVANLAYYSQSLGLLQVTPTLLLCSLRSEHYNRRIFAQVLIILEFLCIHTLLFIHFELVLNSYYNTMFTLAEILTSNSVGTQLFSLGCKQDNNSGIITKKKICSVHQKWKLATIEINKFLI